MSAVKSDTYQQEYDAEMAKLEAGDTSTSKVEAEANTETQTPDEIQALKQQLANQEKALKDTQRWGHGLSNKVANLEKERENLKKQQSRPTILDDNPGLEDAIKHIAGTNEQENPDVPLVAALERALPELDGLLDYPDFKDQFMDLRKDSIDAWRQDPLTAIRDINKLQSTYQSGKAKNDALKDFQEKQKKLGSMSVPGGSGGKGISKDVDEAQAMRDMPKAEFDKLRSKVMGY